MTQDQNARLLSVFEETLRYIDLLKQSSERLKERTQQAGLPAEERNGLLSEIGNIDRWLKAMEPDLRTHLRERKISSYIASSESMWTTEKEDWWLVEHKGSNESLSYSIEYAAQPGTLNFEDAEWYEYVRQIMKEAGNLVVSYSAYEEFIAHYLAGRTERSDSDENT